MDYKKTRQKHIIANLAHKMSSSQKFSRHFTRIRKITQIHTKSHNFCRKFPQNLSNAPKKVWRKLNYQKFWFGFLGEKWGWTYKVSGNTQLHAVRTFICTTLHLSQCHHKCNARFIRHFATAKRTVLSRCYCCYCSLTRVILLREMGNNESIFATLFIVKNCRYQRKVFGAAKFHITFRLVICCTQF